MLSVDTNVLVRLLAGDDREARTRTGAALMPQLPTITVVTPCDNLGSISGLRIT